MAQDLPYLQGHFPGLPLVPAVILMEISQAFLRSALNQPAWRSRRARHCKFKGMVTPGETYRLTAEGGSSGYWYVTWVREPDQGAGAVVELNFEP